jgi:hypothetical protein
MRNVLARLERVEAALDRLAGPKAPEIDWDGMTDRERWEWWAEHLPRLLRWWWTGELEFARTLEGFDGKFVREPGAGEKIGKYLNLMYLNLGDPYAFVPGADPRYEEARRDVVAVMRRVLEAEGDGLVALLEDKVLRELDQVRWRAFRERFGQQARGAGP